MANDDQIMTDITMAEADASVGIDRREARPGDLIVGEPTDDRMAKIAASCVDLVRKHFDEHLDYVPESLDRLDRVILRAWGEGASQGSPSIDLVTLFGAYFGETIVRHSRGRWVSGYTREEPGTILYVGLGDTVQASISPFRLLREKLADPIGTDLLVLYRAVEAGLRDAGAA